MPSLTKSLLKLINSASSMLLLANTGKFELGAVNLEVEFPKSNCANVNLFPHH